MRSYSSATSTPDQKSNPDLLQLLDYIVNMSGYRREYVQCPICSRSYPLKFIEEHASTCVSGVSSATKSSAAEKASQRKQASKPKTTTNAFSFLSKSSKKVKKGSDKSGAKSSEANGVKHVKKKTEARFQQLRSSP